jgi:hypothetical protein
MMTTPIIRYHKPTLFTMLPRTTMTSRHLSPEQACPMQTQAYMDQEELELLVIPLLELRPSSLGIQTERISTETGVWVEQGLLTCSRMQKWSR